MTWAERGENKVEVKMNLAYSMSTKQEFDFPRHLKRIKYFHYELDLDDDGKIVGGDYFRDSSRMDMLWIPMQPVQGGEEGNKRGNPHVDVKEVLAIWRASVDEELRSKWFNIDPTDEDKIEVAGDETASDAGDLSESSEDSEPETGENPAPETVTSADAVSESGRAESGNDASVEIE